MLEQLHFSLHKWCIHFKITHIFHDLYHTRALFLTQQLDLLKEKKEEKKTRLC